jgi:hypothetical protein
MTILTDAAQPAALPSPAPPDSIDPLLIQDAHRDVLLAVQRVLAATWTEQLPRFAVREHDSITTVYVSTLTTLGPVARADVRGVAGSALAPYVSLAPFTNVVFLTRGRF